MQTHDKPQAVGGSRRTLLGSALLALLLSSGCQSNAGTGALAGGGIGAAIGALAGGPRHSAAGALIGGAAGALTGGAIGNAEDNKERRREERLAQAVAHPPLSLEQIQQLSAHGTSDGVIIEQIRVTGSVYNLTAEQILWLKDNGVHEAVIQEMQATAYRVPRRVYSAAPAVYQPAPVVVVEPPPPPVGIGFSYSVGRRW